VVVVVVLRGWGPARKNAAKCDCVARVCVYVCVCVCFVTVEVKLLRETELCEGGWSIGWWC
jgi:hypothetical protein